MELSQSLSDAFVPIVEALASLSLEIQQLMPSVEEYNVAVAEGLTKKEISNILSGALNTAMQGGDLPPVKEVPLGDVPKWQSPEFWIDHEGNIWQNYSNHLESTGDGTYTLVADLKTASESDIQYTTVGNHKIPSDMIIKSRQLSYSSLQQYDKCQFTWLGKYVIGTERVDTMPLTLGTLIHEALEDTNRYYIEHGDYPDSSQAVSRFSLALSKVMDEHETPSGKLVATMDDFWQGQLPEDLLEIGAKLLDKYMTKFAEDYVPLEAEGARELDLHELYPYLDLKFIDRFVGQIDVLCVGDLIIDYKVRASPSNKKFMHLDIQPTAYAALLGKPITAHFVELIRNPKWPKVQVFETARLQEDIDWFIERYLANKAREIDDKLVQLHDQFPSMETVHEMSEKDPEQFKWMLDSMARLFPPSPSWACDFCDFRGPCGYQLPALDDGY